MSMRLSYAANSLTDCTINFGRIEHENETNDGHFYFQYFNFLDHDLEVKKGDVIGQVIFQKFLVADNDNATGKRSGGFGSTDSK